MLFGDVRTCYEATFDPQFEDPEKKKKPNDFGAWFSQGLV